MLRAGAPAGAPRSRASGNRGRRPPLGLRGSRSRWRVPGRALLGAPFFGRLGGGHLLEFGLGPSLTGLPVGFHLAAKLLPRCELLADSFGLLCRKTPRPGAATHHAGEA